MHSLRDLIDACIIIFIIYPDRYFYLLGLLPIFTSLTLCEMRNAFISCSHIILYLWWPFACLSFHVKALSEGETQGIGRADVEAAFCIENKFKVINVSAFNDSLELSISLHKISLATHFDLQGNVCSCALCVYIALSIIVRTFNLNCKQTQCFFNRSF